MPTWPRRPRLNVRGLMILIALVALGLAYWELRLNAVRRWREAIRDDDDGPRRWEAINIVATGPQPSIGRATAIDELIEALGDPGDRVRHHAALCLGSFGPEAARAAPALVRTLRDPFPAARECAAISLGQVLEGQEEPPAVVLRALAEAAAGPSTNLRLMASISLARLGAVEAALPGLGEGLASTNSATQDEVFRVLEALGPRARPARSLLEAVREQALPGNGGRWDLGERAARLLAVLDRGTPATGATPARDDAGARP